MPKITPFYAVKSNPDNEIVKLLMKLGCGFDCASQKEMSQVLSNGCSPDKIIFANPCKLTQHLQFAKENNINTLTFDGIEELEKIKSLHSDCKVVIRIRTNDASSIIQLSSKFGASEPHWESLIQKCKELSLNLIGVSFHCGSGCSDPKIFSDAIHDCKKIFILAKKYGFDLTFLDIGGGFSGSDDSEPKFEDFAKTINSSINENFQDVQNLQIIAEPGRFFSEQSYSIFCKIISRKICNFKDKIEENSQIIINEHNQKLKSSQSSEIHNKYYVKESTVLFFNGVLFEETQCIPLLVDKHDGEPLYKSSVCGNSNCVFDVISNEVELPLLKIDEFIYFENMGAYTIACSNGVHFHGYRISEDKNYCWIESSLN
jgi:ornithine decarboxylase